ncbi:endonuclease domain-containing protein [Leifsonia sp. EB34]|uniref:endonuclease domain-containing protein n=1 Tax=Leifsonia sp. EB34 TaxID=3156303 RepID=UPI00351176D9
MRRPEPLPPILRSPAFSASAATAAGVSSARLRRSDLVAPFHGARVPCADFDGGFRSRCVAYRAVMLRSQCFSHGTAARIYKLTLPRRLHESSCLHVAALDGRRAPRGDGVVGHKTRLSAEQVRVHDGMRVPDVEEVLCQLAATLTVDELIMAGDSCVRRKNPLTTASRLTAAARVAWNRPGVNTLRAAISQVRADTDSPMETLLRLALIAAGLPEPVVNRPIRVGTGRELHGDLVYAQHRVVVEYDGDHHRTEARQYYGDVDRIWALESAGWRVVRVNRSHLDNGAAVAVARVRAALDERGRNTPL